MIGAIECTYVRIKKPWRCQIPEQKGILSNDATQQLRISLVSSPKGPWALTLGSTPMPLNMQVYDSKVLSLYCLCIVYVLLCDHTFQSYRMVFKPILWNFYPDFVHINLNSVLICQDFSNVVMSSHTPQRVTFFTFLSQLRTKLICWFEQWVDWNVAPSSLYTQTPI